MPREVALIVRLGLLGGLAACGSDSSGDEAPVASPSESSPAESSSLPGEPSARPGSGGAADEDGVSSGPEPGEGGAAPSGADAGSAGDGSNLGGGGSNPGGGGSGGTPKSSGVGGSAQDDPPPPAGLSTDEQWFLPWETFASVDGAEPLRAPLEVRWLSTGSARNDENLVVAIATESGNNRIVTLSATPYEEPRAFRDHGIHFACGDCEMAAMSSSVVVATDTELYGSRDGGESYFEIAPLEQPVERLFLDAGQVYARTASGWLSAPVLEAQTLAALPWPHGVAHIYADTALEVTDDEVRLFLPEETLTSARPCPAPALTEPFGFGRYDTRVFVACEGGAVATSEDFPAEPFAIWDLGEAVRWVGPAFYVATDTAWYSTGTQTEGHRVGGQTPLVEGERVWAHAEGARVAFRVTSHGVGWTYTGMISE